MALGWCGQNDGEPHASRRMAKAQPATFKRVLVTGGTGYLGRALIPQLLRRGHHVRALVRFAGTGGTEKEVRRGRPVATEVIVGDPLNSHSIAQALAGCDTLVQLVGVPKPSPAKADQFKTIDFGSIEASVAAAVSTRPRPHIVYLSVAQPASVMKAYVEVRAAGEALIKQHGLPATFLRPWYVLGPGHRWPYVLLPVYAVLRLFSATRETAQRLGFVTLDEMTCALVRAIENPPESGTRIVEVPAIKAARAELG
jgi:uncharacterized protein YbjT (DUF2867 family)